MHLLNICFNLVILLVIPFSFKMVSKTKLWKTAILIKLLVSTAIRTSPEKPAASLGKVEKAYPSLSSGLVELQVIQDPLLPKNSPKFYVEVLSAIKKEAQMLHWPQHKLLYSLAPSEKGNTMPQIKCK